MGASKPTRNGNCHERCQRAAAPAWLAAREGGRQSSRAAWPLCRSGRRCPRTCAPSHPRCQRPAQAVPGRRSSRAAWPRFLSGRRCPRTCAPSRPRCQRPAQAVPGRRSERATWPEDRSERDSPRTCAHSRRPHYRLLPSPAVLAGAAAAPAPQPDTPLRWRCLCPPAPPAHLAEGTPSGEPIGARPSRAPPMPLPPPAPLPLSPPPKLQTPQPPAPPAHRPPQPRPQCQSTPSEKPFRFGQSRGSTRLFTAAVVKRRRSQRRGVTRTTRRPSMTT